MFTCMHFFLTEQVETVNAINLFSQKGGFMNDITNEQRKLITSLMRKGYGVHPDRDVVLIESALIGRSGMKAQLIADASRFSEADFVVIDGGDLGLSDDDNIYCPHQMTGEELEFLEEIAVLHLLDSATAEPDQVSDTILKAMEKEGFNRTGTVMLAVEEGDTSYKIHLDRHREIE